MQRPRRINDAQVERLLAAMRDVNYRRALTVKSLKREGVRQFTPTGKITSEYKRRYSSTMRRFQRYVTASAEKRSFARAPVQYQRQARALARSMPALLPAARPLPEPRRLREPKYEEEYEEEEVESRADTDFYDSQSNAILRSIVAYYDGDVDEAARAMNLTARGERLLALAVAGEGVSISAMRGAGEVYDNLRDLLDTLTGADIRDITDFHDLLQNLPDWQIGMILADLEDENTTFADWLDAWRDADMDLDVSESDYWALWRQAYARSKA